jgi:hypothetical protein
MRRSITRWHRRAVRGLSASLLWGSLGLFGCYAEELAELREKVERLQACNSCAQSQLIQGLSLALCSPPVRQLIDTVGNACRSQEICLDQKISTLVGDADPTHTGKFITLMRPQRHAVLYFAPNDTLIGGPQGLFAQRLKTLALPQPPWLPTTRFLVVSNLKPPSAVAGATDGARLSTTDPAVARAERRGQQVIELLLDFGFPNSQGQTQKVDRKQILHWVYAFTRKKDESLLYEEQPAPGSDLSQSVWVFRIDCATPEGTGAEAVPSTCSQCSIGPGPLGVSGQNQSLPPPSAPLQSLPGGGPTP